MRPLISLVGIFKNEAASIRELLEAALPHVDRATLLDTGSTDDTVKIAREVLAASGKPHQLGSASFVDFATTRNRVMDLEAKQTEPAIFTLMLSGDEYLRNGEALRETLEKHRTSDVDAFHLPVEVKGEAKNPQIRIARVGSFWRYEKKVHEDLCNRMVENAAVAPIEGAWIEHIVSDPERRFESVWETHVPLLEAALEEDPCDAHALVYLARSYEMLFPFMQPGERLTYAMRAMSLYLRRLALPILVDAERDYYLMAYLDNARLTGVYNAKELMARCLELKTRSPRRPEIALLCANVGMLSLPVVEVYKLAAETAQIAREAVANPPDAGPVSLGCEWKAHLIALKAAKQISERQPGAMANNVSFADLLTVHREAGIAAGGPPQIFDDILAREPYMPAALNGVPQQPAES